jgi:hypothetical protein
MVVKRDVISEHQIQDASRRVTSKRVHVQVQRSTRVSSSSLIDPGSDYCTRLLATHVSTAAGPQLVWEDARNSTSVTQIPGLLSSYRTSDSAQGDGLRCLLVVFSLNMYQDSEEPIGFLFITDRGLPLSESR